MSGNPFRRQAQTAQSASFPPELDTLDSQHQVDSQPAGRGSNKVKRVRIETPPPLSPDSPYEDDTIIRRVSNEAHEGSPPPSPDSPPDETMFPPPLDAFDPSNQTAAAEELFPSIEVLENTRRNSETNVARRDSTGGIVNPFQRTLATIEQTDPYTSESANDPAALESKAGKTHMDVDAFKRMLMTGDPGAVSDTASSSGPSTSTTNAGSYFALDNYDPVTSAQSGQNSRSITNSDSEKRRSKPPPPPPAHRHGKPVEQQKAPPTTTSDSSISNEAPMSPSEGPIPKSTAAPSLSTPTSGDSGKKNPPAPPQARRAGSTNSNRNSLIRENSSSSIPQQPLASPPLPSPSTTKPAPSKPPPPPARRGGSKSTNPSLETNASQFTTPPQSEDASIPASSSRSSSVASKNRISVNAPPPPPPPRGRGSSKSSLERPTDVPETGELSTSDSSHVGHDLGATENESALHSEPGTGTSDLNSSTKSGVSESDILADMDRLQAEVDALRARYTGSKQ